MRFRKPSLGVEQKETPSTGLKVGKRTEREFPTDSRRQRIDLDGEMVYLSGVLVVSFVASFVESVRVLEEDRNSLRKNSEYRMLEFECSIEEPA